MLPIAGNVSVCGNLLHALNHALKNSCGDIVGYVFSAIGKRQQGVPRNSTDDVVRWQIPSQTFLVGNPHSLIGIVLSNSS